MEKNVRIFLESGLLEEYLMGTCSDDEKAKVEHYIKTYPAVEKEFNDLKKQINNLSEKLKSDAPSGLKEAIISCLEDETHYDIKSRLVKKPKPFLGFVPWAAAIIGFITTVALFNQKNNLQKSNMELHAEMNMINHQLDYVHHKLKQMKAKLALSCHNKTERILLSGNDLSPDFQSTAIWNDVAGEAILYINNFGELDNRYCYQIWADVDGHMINVGIIPKKEGPVEIKHLQNATSLNITIEPEGGSASPNVNKIVSSKALIKI